MGSCTSRDGTNSRTLIWDRLYKSGGKGIVGIPGLNGTDWPVDSADPTVVAAGYSKAVIASGALWGNSTHQTRVTDARTALSNSFAVATKVWLSAGSMGAAAAFNWAKANPTLVQGIVASIPAVDLQDIDTNNRGGNSASVQAAWGGAVPDASCPAKNTASFTTIPTLIYYSTDDPICVPSVVTAFGSAIGATMVSLGAVGHATTGANPQAAIDFMNSH